MIKEKTEKITDRYLKVQSVVEILSCTDGYVYELIQAGTLTAVKIGERAIRISQQSLQAFLATRVINPEDYLAPKEPVPEPGKTKKIARSNWMNR